MAQLLRRVGDVFRGMALGAFTLAVIWIAGAISHTLPVSAENYTKVNLTEVDFSGQDLRGDEFTFANLRLSNFSNANLQGVSLFGCHADNANFSNADLRDATLDSAVFRGADLSNARLERVFASNTQFNGATIEGADFTDALMRSDTQVKLCKIASGNNSVTGRATRDTLFCD